MKWYIVGVIQINDQSLQSIHLACVHKKTHILSQDEVVYQMNRSTLADLLQGLMGFLPYSCLYQL